MKVQILDVSGRGKKEISTEVFDGEIREDVMQKIIESEKIRQEYAPFFLAGNQKSASGKIRHLRHAWKTATGRGMSKIPRKIMWRRGGRFGWEGATIPSAKGGRRAHPPKLGGKLKKINKKEMMLGLKSAVACTASADMIKKKYSRLKDKDIKIKLPLVIEEKVLNLKIKEFFSLLKKILGDAYEVAIQKKSVRAGKGKLRGRKYKKNAGLLLVIGNKEDKKIKGIEVKKVKEIEVRDLGEQGGRLAVFSEEGVKDLEDKFKKYRKEDEEGK